MNICPCCGLYEHEKPAGSDDVCPICMWEDNAVQLNNIHYKGGANPMSLHEAREMYAKGINTLGEPIIVTVTIKPKTVTLGVTNKGIPVVTGTFGYTESGNFVLQQA